MLLLALSLALVVFSFVMSLLPLDLFILLFMLKHLRSFLVEIPDVDAAATEGESIEKVEEVHVWAEILQRRRPEGLLQLDVGERVAQAVESEQTKEAVEQAYSPRSCIFFG